MYTLLDSCLDRIEIFGFMERVFAGLNDQHDIKVLAHLMMMRLANVAPTPVTQSTLLFKSNQYFASERSQI